MKILAIGFIFNERPYLPELIRYYKNQGCELYLIDNMSTDGTFEYLQENNIPSHQFDTGECFHLDWLQAETNKVIHEIKPDWIVYIAGDLYHIFEKSIEHQISVAEILNLNQIETTCFEFFHTGEYNNNTNFIPLYKNFFFGREYRPLVLVSKYHESLKLIGDDIFILGKQILHSTGLSINYGGCKPKEIQEAKLQRTYNAWNKGMNNGWSHHFPENKKSEWLWDKSDLQHYSGYDKYGIIEKFLKEN